MLRLITVALVALLAATALAAPTPLQELQKRSRFRIHSPARWNSDKSQRNPAKEMVRTYAKYGWQIVFADPASILGSLFGGGDGSSSSSGSSSSGGFPFPEASSSAAPAYSIPATASAPAYSSPPMSSTAPASSKGSNNDGAVVVTKTVIASAPATASASAAKSGVVGEATATPEANDSEYLTPVTIGGQTLNLDFDTGSSDLWVFSADLPSSETSGHTLFDPSKSSTWQQYQGGSWQISYGDGSTASGTVGFDVVQIGGATVTKQAVELATSVSGSFESDTNNDGLVGLAFSNINTVQPEPQKTFFENIMDSLAAPLFTANLEDNAAGTYTFGEIDSSEYSGDIHYAAVDNSQGFWQVTSTSYSINGQTSQSSNASPAIIDTGTSLLLVDDDLVSAYYGSVSSAYYDSTQAGYIYDCNADLPSFGVAVGDYMATIQGKDVTFAELGDGTCYGGIQSNQGQGLQIFGDVLLKQFLVVFDGGNMQVGFATK